MQGVERVEEGLEGLGCALQELDVVDQQDVDVAVASLELLGLTELARLHRVDEVVREFLGIYVPDLDV